MSQENIEVVMSAIAPESVDYVRMFRDDAAWATQAEATARYYHEDVECRMVRFDGEASYKGLESLRAAWLDWLAPWASYRVEVHDVVDLGDRVLVPAYNLSRPHGSTEEIRMDGAALFTLRDGRIAAAEFYADRADALRDAGVEGYAMSPEEKLDLALRSYAAFSAGPDVEALLPLYDPACEWRFGDMLLDTPAVFIGHAGLREMARWLEGWVSAFTVTIEEARIAADGRMLIKHRVDITSAVKAAEISEVRWQEGEFTDCQILRVAELGEPPAGWTSAKALKVVGQAE